VLLISVVSKYQKIIHLYLFSVLLKKNAEQSVGLVFVNRCE